MKMNRFVSTARMALCAAAVLAAMQALAGKAVAAEALVAVATNFSDVLKTLDPKFETASGHRLRFSSGSTGKLYAQIVNGAPFDIMLAADTRRPELLEASVHGVAGSRFTYAVGRLALWSEDSARIGADGASALKGANFKHLAMANPKLAPYGMAARQTLESLGLWEALQGRIVLGENIGQAFSLVATGNAELGFVALSALKSPGSAKGGSRWDVPLDLYKPIRQDAVLLAHGRENPAAQAFLAFLQSADARKIIATFGYGAD